MSDEKASKLDLAKRKPPTIPLSIQFDDKNQIKAIDSVKKSIDKLYETLNDQETYDFDKLEKQLKLLNETIDLRKELVELKEEVKNTKVDSVKIEKFAELLDAVKENKPLPIEVDLTRLEKAIIQVEQRVQESSVVDQAPSDYQPVRRVIKVGNRLIFDDQATPSRSGGGGSSSSGGLTNTELRASPVPVEATIDTTGLSTSAKQDTIIGHLDGVETTLGTIDTDTGNISTKIDTLAGAVTGTEMQVDVLTMPSVAVTNAGLTELAGAIDTEVQVDIVGALPAGSNGIGKLTANSGVDIGDVDVTTIIPGTGATNLGKAEDAAHTSGDVGVMDLGVRNDTMADFTGADNDYTPKSVTQKGQVITTNAPRGRKLHQITTITSSTSETTVLTAAASTFHDVYGIIVTNTSATATEVAFKDDTAGTTRFTISAPANDTRGFMLPVDAAVTASATNDNWTASAADSVASLIITVLAVKNL